MPSARAAAGVLCKTGRPSTVSVPESGFSAPVMTLISVDFPAPFSPSSACTSPEPSENETPRSACTPAKDLVIAVASRSAIQTSIAGQTAGAQEIRRTRGRTAAASLMPHTFYPGDHPAQIVGQPILAAAGF